MTHPADPLTAQEMTAACAVAGADRWPDADARQGLRFPVVATAPPSRETLRTWQSGQESGHDAGQESGHDAGQESGHDAGQESGYDAGQESGHGAGQKAVRRAEVVVIDRTTGLVSEAVVNLDQGTVEAWRDAPGANPVLLFDESLNAIMATTADPRWLAALARRGITDITTVQVDPWPAGNFGHPGEEGRRLMRCVSYIRHHPADNGYAHPIEGLVTVVDVGTDEVIEVIDTGPVAVPGECANYGVADVVLRTGLRPLEITQPEGPSFEVDGREIRWQRWRLRHSVHPVEGLVLHAVGYEDQGRVRPILHRASIAEMVVPYGASRATAAVHWWKNAFDAGEWGLGRMIQSLALGCDCLGEIRYFDAVLPDEMGGARTVPNAVCLHEEDYGIGWKHVDLWTGTNEVRRSRRLVLSSISTVGNYEYGFYWYFYLDGTMQLEVKLTGILQTGATEGAAPAHGVLLSPGLWAPNHQHLFCARLDVDVDGPGNSVYEVDVTGAPVGADNPEGNAIVTSSTLLASEQGARRMADPAKSRRWNIVSSGGRNRLGQQTAYALVPTATPTLLADPASSVARRAAFATANLWVTPDRADERRPAGDHPNQSAGGEGLPSWTAADRPLVDTELVVWHTFGVTHLPRPEDWPVMPVEYTGFQLKPVGFFDRNPALDVPPSPGHCDSES
jgi:primary-amine oxidase